MRGRRIRTLSVGFLVYALRATLVAAVFVVPVVFDSRTADGFNLVKATALWVITLAAAALWCVSTLITNDRFIPRSRVLSLAYLLLALTALAAVFSPHPTLSLVGLYHRYNGVASLAMYAAFTSLIVCVYGRRREALRDLVIAVLAAAGLISVYVLLQRVGVDPWHWRSTSVVGPAPVGTLGNSQFSGAYLGAVVPVIASTAVYLRQWSRRILAALIGVTVGIALLITGSRSGIVAALAGLVALVLFGSNLRSIYKVLSVVAILFCLSMVPLAVARTTFSRSEGLLRTDSVRLRAEDWDAGWRMFLNKPILGSGSESYYGNYPRFRSASDAARGFAMIPDKPHNIFLEWLTSVGALGLACYLALATTVVWMVADRACQAPRRVRWLATGFGSAFVAYLAQGLFSIDVPPLALMGWIPVGAIIVLLGSPLTNKLEVSGRTFLPRLGVAVAVPVVLALMLLGLAPMRADHALWAATRRGYESWDEATALYRKAIALNPREATYRALAGAYMEATAGTPTSRTTRDTSLKRAARFYLQANRIQPRNLHFVLSLVRVYSRLGRLGPAEYFGLAEHWMKIAVALEPHDPQLEQRHASLLREWSTKVSDPFMRRDLAEQARTVMRGARTLDQ